MPPGNELAGWDKFASKLHLTILEIVCFYVRTTTKVAFFSFRVCTDVNAFLQPCVAKASRGVPGYLCTEGW